MMVTVIKRTREKSEPVVERARRRGRSSCETTGGERFSPLLVLLE